MTNPIYPLVAIRANGETIHAATPDEAAAFHDLNPGRHHHQGHMWVAFGGRDGPYMREHVVLNEWIVRDAMGGVVDPIDLPHMTRRRLGVLRRHLVAAQDAQARGLPIPGTGRGRRYSSGYRSFHANRSMRAAEAGLADDLADWGVARMRVGRRRTRDLPQVWDDVPYRRGTACWKNGRATQWRDR